MMEQRCSDDLSKRSFIEPNPPLISNPFMSPRPQKRTNLMEIFEEDSECEEPELVQVYLRMKPSTVPNNLYEVRSDHCLITSLDTAPAGHGRRTRHNVSKMYTFSRIFRPDSTQKELFENIIKDNLRKLPEGHSFTLLTYGASGSGKTYTLMGTVQSPGLVPQSLEYLFRIVDAAQQPQYKPSEGGADKLNHAEQNYELQWVKHLRHISAPLRDKYRRMSVNLVNDMTHSTIELSPRVKHYVWVSFVEIYNEGIFDLLVPGDRRASSTLRIREDSSGNVFVKGATQAFVRSGEEACDVMMAGRHNLQVAATGVHAHSSRSHCIFTITVLTEADGNMRSSCARLCDLAGCERARRTKNTGTRMQESRAINSSLHVLERCLHTLRRQQRKRADTHLVPYRESKLTRLLGAGLSGARGEAVSMVVTVNPSPEYAHETKHVLQMADVARDIQINSTIAETFLESSSVQDSTIMCSAEVVRLRSENERMHFELVQAQARHRKQMAIMKEKQQETKEYYEAQLQALRDEDKLTAEQLAKNSAEQEVQYITEFSDVTMDVPAPFKDVKDIPSPERNSEEYENMPPLSGVQSCPSKRHQASQSEEEEDTKAEPAHPLVMTSKIDPKEIPDVPANRFLMRGGRDKDDRERVDRRDKERARFRERDCFGYTRSGRMIKGRGAFRYRTPSRSRSRSRWATPPHWRQAQRRTIKSADFERLEHERTEREVHEQKQKPVENKFAQEESKQSSRRPPPRAPPRDGNNEHRADMLARALGVNPKHGDDRARFRERDRFGYTRSGRMIKRRGVFPYRTPSRSRSRSRSATPAHWRQALRRAIKNADIEPYRTPSRSRSRSRSATPAHWRQALRRAIKNADFERHRTPSRSRSRSRSATPPHWRQAQRRAIKYADFERLEHERTEREVHEQKQKPVENEFAQSKKKRSSSRSSPGSARDMRRRSRSRDNRRRSSSRGRGSRSRDTRRRRSSSSR